MSVAYLRAEQRSGDNTINLTLDVAIADLELAIGVDTDRDGAVTWGELRGRSAAIAEFVVEGVQLAAGGAPCRVQPGTLAVRDYAEGAYAHQPLTARCGTGDPTLDYKLLLDRDAQHRAILIVERDGKTMTSLLDSGHRSARLAAPRSTFQAFLREGVHHILIGYDHLAFLFSLLLSVALTRREGRWQRTGTLGQSFRRAGGLVTAFTLAHSLTLTLAALGLVTPVGRWIEAAIALSVTLAALNNVWPVIVRRLWLLALGFGLVHGFGFAGALGEIGVPRDARLTALFAFNFGVELGQLGIAAIALPLIHALSAWRHYVRSVMIPLSLLIAALGAWWLLQRMAVM
ncbi:MAG: HupE/UreJ family protein [Lysobacterales bacterium]